jgi:hypothetical protein
MYICNMKQFRDTEYYVTEDGKIYSNKFNKWREMKPSSDKDGYLQLNLYTNNKLKTYKIHRLVAECYLSNSDNLPLVEHKDDIKTNNHVSNLMWSNHSNNTKNAYKTGLKKPVELKGEKHPSSKLTEEQVKWIRENYIPQHSQFGGKALSKKFGVGNHQISRIINNKIWTHI